MNTYYNTSFYLFIFCIAVFLASSVTYLSAINIYNRTGERVRLKIATQNREYIINIRNGAFHFISEKPMSMTVYTLDGHCSYFSQIEMNSAFDRMVLVNQRGSSNCVRIGFTGQARTHPTYTMPWVPFDPTSCSRRCWNPLSGLINSETPIHVGGYQYSSGFVRQMHIVNRTGNRIRVKLSTRNGDTVSDIENNESFFLNETPITMVVYSRNGYCSYFSEIDMNPAFDRMVIINQRNNPYCTRLGFTGEARTGVTYKLPYIPVDPTACKSNCWNPTSGAINLDVPMSTAGYP